MRLDLVLPLRGHIFKQLTTLGQLIIELETQKPRGPTTTQRISCPKIYYVGIFLVLIQLQIYMFHQYQNLGLLLK